MRDDKMPIKLDRKVIYESEWICLYTDRVQMPDGKIIDSYHRLHYPKESVCIVILNEDGEILLVRSKRYSTSQLEWEVPAGSIDPGETPWVAAKREVLEETGYLLKELVYLCSQNPSNGMSDEKIYIFGARAKVQKGKTDENEVSDQRWFTKTEILSMLKNNEIKCGISMLAILYSLQFYV